MILAQPHEKEQERLKELESFSILRTIPELDYDDLTAIAAQICDTPISLVSLLEADCQWFKSHHGLDLQETPRNISFCGHAINQPSDIFIVEDATKDERFFDNPLVTGPPYIQFYAGVSLMSDNGLPLGTLCVVGNEPKTLTNKQIQSLKALSRQTMNVLNLRKSKLELEKALKELLAKNQELDRFASIAAHDIKSPLAGIQGMIMLFTEQYRSVLDEHANEMLSLIQNSSEQLQSLIEGILMYSKGDNILQDEKSTIKISELEKDMLELFSSETKLNFTVNSQLEEITTNPVALKQVLLNLIANGIKYNDKDHINIELGISGDTKNYYFYVSDNGPGIPQENREKIFRIFEVTTQTDRYGETGHGIGLATVKKIVDKFGGDLTVDSELGQGSKFCFTFKK
ncbi:sensor histidine kinase [Gaetbulibacter aestuarii]|uniref:histidine kinase n=1 Tax=Gaetbulibacter aestuarii TaxID=1502358 RepID=A0ABW7MYA5_9FLAO